MEEKTGVIEQVYIDRNGTLRDDDSGKIVEFNNPAVLDIEKGQGVQFVLINTPNGPIRIIRKGKS